MGLLSIVAIVLILMLLFGLVGGAASFIISLLVGALIGWLASLIMKTDDQQGTLANIAIGILGSVLGRWLFADVLGIGSASASGTFSLLGILWGVVGSIVLVAILKAVKVLR